jgi:AbrB family looped-hinge helix DNA binding protein
MLRKLGQNNQIAVPKEIVERLGLSVNDYLDVRLEGARIILEPQVMVPKDQQYFYTPEWQVEEKEAVEDIKAGRVTKTRNVQDLFKKLG